MVASNRTVKPAVIVVMGVASSGKTSLGERLAAQLGWPFRDADSFHPPENVAKMAGGTPLTDEDRKPWLAAIAAWIDDLRASGKNGIVTCSALKRAYRRVIVGDRADVALVYLKGSRELIGERMAQRQHHFMPTALLDSQFATLEEPGEDEQPLVVSVESSKDAIVADVLTRLGLA
ncbi:MAG TPA: gluconokinase [Bosea sp. (in: a-proteobacteria)]|jgi:carbohydrate kinase (thermoresistant glucokinase family)|uniref:gluconokinase n=1 Tax=Bosea sp. (in: a-proteobacteria) TaxID=1871050 RepID=UPI002DDCF7DA|nr:gluconokinase [Bosea sp. (in: a-proteobacteria)]HEV2556154.1 gluconokinase [Bosea sp. (in: a-proteobacteria)]